METAILLLVAGAVNVACFFIGAKTGQSVAREEKIEMPELNPVKAVYEKVKKDRADNEAKRQEKIMNTMWSNIENYNGTEMGQRDIPL